MVIGLIPCVEFGQILDFWTAEITKRVLFLLLITNPYYSIMLKKDLIVGEQIKAVKEKNK